MSTVQNLQFEDEDIVIGKSSNAADARFDQIIGSIEDIIMEPKFQQMQDQFMNKNYKHFEDSEENKLVYTTIHKEYVNQVEKYLEQSLQKRIENFSMDEFMKELMKRKEELDGCEIFEILLTFDDFLEFKAMMLGYRADKEGKSLDLGLCVRSLNADSSRANQTARNGANKNTPLLDRAQVDSDNE